jgi:lipase ATG15
VDDNGWRVDIRSHRIRDVIADIFEKPDEFPLPDCAPERDCQDCGLWDYFDERDPELPTDPSKIL